VASGELTIYTQYNGDFSQGIYEIALNITDGYYYQVIEWLLTVEDLNPEPVIISKDPETQSIAVSEGLAATFTIDISDPDGSTPLIQWLYDDVTIDNESGRTFVFHPDYSSSGNHTIKVKVIDSGDNQQFVSFTWNINVKNTDRPPMIIDAGPLSSAQKTDEETPISFYINATDLDGDAITYKWFIGSSHQAGITASVLNFVPDYSSGSQGPYVILVQIISGSSLREYNWTLTVIDVNRAPSLNTTGFLPEDQGEFVQGEKVEMSASAEDPDGDSVTYRWEILETGELLSESQTFNHQFEKPGDYTVSLTVYDGKGGNVTKEVSIKITKKEDSPGFLFSYLMSAILLILVIMHIYRKK